MTKMTVIRVSEETARKVKFYGKTYEDGVKALLDNKDNDKVDYDRIKKIVSDELLRATMKY